MPESNVNETQLKRELNLRTRRGFLIGGLAAAAGLGGWEWLRTRGFADGIPWPLRRGLEANEAFARAYSTPSRMAREFPRGAAEDVKVNGDIGIDDEDFDASQWELNVEGLARGAVMLKIGDIKALPRVEMTTELKCIEGWSQVVNWAGARMVDFIQKYPPRDKDANRYVALETPDAEYYVGLHMTDAVHPQTLLAYEMNGVPLSDDHGAPLRLVIPLKYGIKNLKRIGLIRYSNDRPKDYWAERGYDWYAGF